MYSLRHAEALKDIYLPLKVDKLEKYDKCFKKTEKSKFKVSIFCRKKSSKPFFVSEVLSCHPSAIHKKSLLASKDLTNLVKIRDIKNFNNHFIVSRDYRVSLFQALLSFTAH